MTRIVSSRSGAAAALVLISTVPLVLGFLGALHPAFDSFSHFRAHLAVVTGAMALPLLATRFRIEAAAALALAVAAFATTRDDAVAVAAPAQDRATYRLLHLNLRERNPTPERVLSLIGAIKPDVVTLNEVSAAWAARLDTIAAAYPHRIVCTASAPTRGTIAAVAILSRRPFAAEPAPCLEDGRFASVAIDFGGGIVDIAALHLDWPWPFRQPRQAARIAPTLAGLGETAIAAGDFNAVPWSHAVRGTAEASGYGVIGGIGPTWLHFILPAGLRPWIGLPIDQVLARGGFDRIDAVAGPDAGSDHAPVIVTFSPSLRPPSGGGALQADAPLTQTRNRSPLRRLR